MVVAIRTLSADRVKRSLSAYDTALLLSASAVPDDTGVKNQLHCLEIAVPYQQVVVLQEFHAATEAYTATVAIMGLLNGRMMDL